MKNRLHTKPFGWLILPASILMVYLVPLLTNFLKNRSEVAVQALVLPLLFASIATGLIYVFFRPLFRRDPLAAYIGSLLVAVLLSTNYEARLSSAYAGLTALVPLPDLGKWQGTVFSIIFLALVFFLSRRVGKFFSRLVQQKAWSADLIGGIFVAIAATFVFQLIPAVRTIVVAWPQYFYKPPKLASLQPAANKPDIYYIVLDRYASQTVLKTQFDFNNDRFINFLDQQGFYINPDAHQNYPYTTESIASTLNANYNVDLINRFAGASAQTIVPYHRSIQDAAVASALKSIGYSYSEIGTWYEATNRSMLTDHFYLPDSQLTLLGWHNSIDNFTKFQISQSLFWRPIQAGVRIGGFKLLDYQAKVQSDLNTSGLNTLKSLVAAPAGGRFIFAHLLIPHDPYSFLADGSISPNPDNDDVGQPIKQKYLGQVKFINSQMEQILADIKSHSHGQALIILQSDEGPYPIQLNDHVYSQSDVNSELNNLDMRQWSNTDLFMKYGNLAAYYIPKAGAADLAKGANNLNVFRLVFNNYFGTTMPYLGQCYYVFPSGRKAAFVYSDITARLTREANPGCAPDGTGERVMTPANK